MSQAGPINDQGSGSLPPDVPTEVITNSGTAVPSLNGIALLGTGSITTTGIGNVITINVSGTGFTWNTTISPSNPTQIVAENAYITGGASQCVFILPLTAAIGDAFVITGNTSLFQITQNASQYILFGIQTTTAGATGSLTSTSFADHVEVVCIVSNLGFKVIDSIGNLTVV